jgi:hypothetical protein
MRRFPLLAALAALSLALAGDAAAQTASVKLVFVAVDAVTIYPGTLVVKGILEGQETPVEKSLTYYRSYEGYVEALDACHRSALVAMERPGAYRLELTPASTAGGFPFCTLARVTP